MGGVEGVADRVSGFVRGNRRIIYSIWRLTHGPSLYNAAFSPKIKVTFTLCRSRV